MEATAPSRATRAPSQLGALDLGSRSAWLARLALAGVTLAGAALRLFLIGDKSLWLDEAFSVILAQRSVGEVLREIVLTDTHPPLYYLALHAWVALGDSEAMVRSLSAIFSIASIPLMYLVGKALYEGRRAGLLAATVLAFSPFQIWYAQEARMYAMLTFMVLASAYFFVRALRRGAWIDWLGFVLATALALYTDNGGVWYVIAIGLFFVASVRRFRQHLPRWLMSQVAIAALYVPWAPFFLIQTRRVVENFWLPAPTVRAVVETLVDFQSLNFPWLAVSTLYLTGALVWAYIIPTWQGWSRRLLTFWLVVPLALSLLLSLRQPIFLSRNLIAASLALYLLLAGAIWHFGSNRMSVLFLLPLLAMNVLSIGYNARFEAKEEWRSAAAHMAQQIAAEREQTGREPLLLFAPGFAELPFGYYFERYGQDVDTLGYPQQETLLHPQPVTQAETEARILARPSLWLIVRGEAGSDVGAPIQQWLASQGYRVVDQWTQWPILIYRYSRE
jgi:4-amino-4-deoxy-L-arabinose transferase-like glycosyltransferase